MDSQDKILSPYHQVYLDAYFIDKYEAFIALGCIIKGQTLHFNYLCSSVINALANLSIKSKKPIGNGIITCLNKKQALERLNKGEEASKAVLQVFQNK